MLLIYYRCSSLENECEDTKREKSALEVRITEMQRRRYVNCWINVLNGTCFDKCLHLKFF